MFKTEENVTLKSLFSLLIDVEASLVLIQAWGF